MIKNDLHLDADPPKIFILLQNWREVALFSKLKQFKYIALIKKLFIVFDGLRLA